MNLNVLRPGKSARKRYLLIPNINQTGRELPSDVSPSSLGSVTIDKDAKVRRLSDKEIYPVAIDVTDEELQAAGGITLECRFDPDLFTVLNRSGIPMTGGEPGTVTLDLGEEKRFDTKGVMHVYLEAQTFVGSPLLDPNANKSVNFRFLDSAGAVLEALPRNGDGEVRPADVILLGDHHPPERVLMCELDENQPSVRDVKQALSIAAVPLTLIPVSVGMGDSWMQDQFQLAYTSNGAEDMLVIIHLTRMLNNSALVPTSPNLKNFVESYFPSRDVGVLNDFWERPILINDGQNSLSLSAAESFPLFRKLGRMRLLLGQIFNMIEQLDRKRKAEHLLFGRNWNNLYEIRRRIETSFKLLTTFTNATDDQRRKIAELRRLIDAESATLALDARGVVLTIEIGEKKGTFVFDKSNKDELNLAFSLLLETHHSSNYGGNIEVSPPTTDAPYGKIITGDIESVPLRAFLSSRGPTHPHAVVWTDWLEVGHVDEILSFVEDGRGKEGWSLLRAAPLLAVSLLEHARKARERGALVTRLFRGKKWVHEGAMATPLLPPNAYLNLINPKTTRYDLSGFSKKFTDSSPGDFYDSAYHDDRRFLVRSKRHGASARYAADMTCEDLLHYVRSANRAVDLLMLSDTYAYADDLEYEDYYRSEGYKSQMPRRLDKVLKQQFSAVPVVKLPVLFDRQSNFDRASVKAVMPDMINFQTVGRHLLVPKPYGPRMRIDDAIELMRAAAEEDHGDFRAAVRDTLNRAFVKAAGLDRVHHWTRSGERVAAARVGKWPTELDAEFEEMWLSLYQSLYSTNPDFELPSLFEIQHKNDPRTNHPVVITEDLAYIANCFKDGFDEFKNCPVDYCRGDDEKDHPRRDAYEKNIALVKDRINKANPGVFGANGTILPKDWTKIVIPEDTVDVFELYIDLALHGRGVRIHWVDSWYYHTHGGGIHCGTNVLRSL